MVGWFRHIDRILRGEATRVADLRNGTVPIPAGTVVVMVAVLGMLYGFFMGWYALINRAEPVYWQLLAATLKVPALFALTLLVTFPSLYVFNALVGSRLRGGAVFKLLLAAMAVTLAVLASFGPITAFFSITTENYSFMVLLNVVLFSAAGMLGLGFLLQTLQRLSVAETALAQLAAVAQHPQPKPPEAPPPSGAAPGAPSPATPPMPPVRPPQGSVPAIAGGAGGAGAPAEPGKLPATPADAAARLERLGALDPLEGHAVGPEVRLVFFCWVIIFALVGAQMSWVLRPFIGNPEQPFEWFRARESNFFEAVFATFQSLTGG